jgi:hypothetical protein
MECTHPDSFTQVKELFWWKHAARCHGQSHIDGEEGFFVDDDVHARILKLMNAHDQSDV